MSMGGGAGAGLGFLLGGPVGAAIGYAAGNALLPTKTPDTKVSKPGAAPVTAAALPQMSQQDALNKKMAASMLTKDWMTPKSTLGQKSLLGL